VNLREKMILDQAVERSSWDPAYFLRFFLRAWFPSELPPFHLGVLALMTRKVEFLNHYPDAHDFLLNEFWYEADPDDKTAHEQPNKGRINVFEKDADGNIVLIADEHNNVLMPRGYSKTTLMNGVNLYEVMTDGTTFVVYISKSSPHAEMQLGNIRGQLEGNELLRSAYGNVVPTRADTEKWQADMLQLRNGAILVAKGRGGQVRGLNFDARRPNRIVLDDVEDDETAKSPTVRSETESWFYTSVEKAGQLMEGMIGEEGSQDPLRITNLGTLLGSECLMMTLAKDPNFSTIKFGAKLRLDDPSDHRMLWAFKESYETYNRERERHRKIGKLAEFTREKDSSIRVSDDAIFPSQFIYAPTPLSDLIHRAQALDPAISERAGADHTAIVVSGRRASDGAIWLLDEWGGTGKTPTDKINMFFEMHQRWMTTHNGIEAVQYQASLIYLMKEEMARRQYFFSITPIRQGREQTKDMRITGMLSPRYMGGIIRHLKPLAGVEGNLADWPNGKKDYADAFAMSLTLLGETQMLALPEAAKNAMDYAPQEERLPPAYSVVGNYIMSGRDPLRSGRYG